MRRFTQYHADYISAAVAWGDYSDSVLWHYDQIVPVIFEGEYPGYLLTGCGIPDGFSVDLTGGMFFNTLPVIERTDLPAVCVSSLPRVLSWLDANNIPYDTDAYGLVVGGGGDGRVLADLSFDWIENLTEEFNN